MTIFDSLSKEHGAMLKLIVRVERAFLRADGGAEARAALAALDHALARHEEIEELVMGPVEKAGEPALARAMREIGLEHADVDRLRAELRGYLERNDRQDEESGRLKVLATLFTRRLRSHFLAEEGRLWPLLARRAGRSVERSLATRAERELKELSAELRALEEGK